MDSVTFTVGVQFMMHGERFVIEELLPGNTSIIRNVETREVRTVKESFFARGLYSNIILPVTGVIKRPRRVHTTSMDNLSADDKRLVLFRLGAIQRITLDPKGRRSGWLYKRELNRVKKLQKSGDLPDYPISDSAIRKWVKIYEDSGNDIMSLYFKEDERGPYRHSSFLDEIEEIIKNAWSLWDMNPLKRGKTAQSVIDEITLQFKEAIESKVIPADAKIPSQDTIRRRFHYYKKLKRPKKSGISDRERPVRPMEIAELDGTVIDLFIRDDEDGEPISRLYIMWLKDVATGYPLGYYVGFDPHSFISVIETLYHAFLPKGDTRKTHGTTNIMEAGGLPLVISADNAFIFKGSPKRDDELGALRDSLIQLGIHFVRGPKRTPTVRPYVERLNRAFNTLLFHAIRGTSFSNPIHRQDYQSMKEVAARFETVGKLVMQALVDSYAQTPNRMLGASPATLWKRHQELGWRPRYPASPRDLLIKLGRKERRTVQTSGIQFRHLYYKSADTNYLINCPEIGIGTEVTFKFHPGDLSRIFVRNPLYDGGETDEPEYFEVPAQAREYTRGLSLFEHERVLECLDTITEKRDPIALAKARRKREELVQADFDAKAGKKTRGQAARALAKGRLPSIEENYEELPEFTDDPEVLGEVALAQLDEMAQKILDDIDIDPDDDYGISGVAVPLD